MPTLRALAPALAPALLIALATVAPRAATAKGPEHEVLAQTGLDEPVMATPAVAGDCLYVRGEEHVYAIGAGAGSPSGSACGGR